MKSINIFYLLLLFVFSSSVLISCSDDDLDGDALTNFPPSVLSVDPVQIIKVGTAFDLTVVFADGASSPLQNGTIRFLDSLGNEVATSTQSLSGTVDTMRIPAADLGSANLPLGNYTIEVTGMDTDNQTVMENFPLNISLQEYKFNQAQMYAPGSYNGWTHQPMTLVADYTWELTAEFDGGEMKFSNCDAWCDLDWGGDAACSGQLEETTGGGANLACVPAGEFKLTFNDNNLTYSFESPFDFATNIENGLFLHGAFNDFNGGEYGFTLVGDNTWEISDVLLTVDEPFRLSDGPMNMGSNWADPDFNGRAEAFAGNMALPSSMNTGFYKITFNDRTLDLTFDFQYFPSVGIIGSATPTGWDSDTDMIDLGDGKYSIEIALIVGEVKFRENDSWDLNWGGDGNGNLVVGGDNIQVTEDGFYEVMMDRVNLTYSLTPKAQFQTIGIIGDATPGGWDSDTDMRDLGDDRWAMVVGLNDGMLKFRADDDWTVNWGSSDFPSGTGVQDGDNIPVTKGIYYIEFNPISGEYSFSQGSIGIIGDATPGSWDNDTDMTETGNVGEVSLSVELLDGQAKFRAQDDWSFNWGSSDFPTGTGVQDGDNIPVAAGNYTITFNVNTGEYRFE